MRSTSWRVAGLLAGVLTAAGAPGAAAQVVGTFPWQMQPYCNVVTLTLGATPAGYTLDGVDDQCAAAQAAGVVGMASFSQHGLVSLTFTIVAAPSAVPVHVAGVVSPATGNGTWTDSAGHSGTLVFAGHQSGLSARPSPGAVAVKGTGAPTFALAPTTTTTVSWTGQAYNTGGGTFLPVAGTYATPADGLYLVTATVPAAFAADGYWCARVFVNGAAVHSACDAASGTASVQSITIATVHRLTAGDVVAIRAVQDTGVTAYVFSPGTEYSSFTVTRIGP